VKLRCIIRRGVLLHSYSERDRQSAMNVLADQEVLYRARRGLRVVAMYC